MESLDIVSLITGDKGQYVMIGMMVAFPMGYGFATRTALKQAREIIDDLRTEKAQLKNELDKYLGKLIS